MLVVATHEGSGNQGYLRYWTVNVESNLVSNASVPWYHTTKELPPSVGTLSGHATADVAVIGGGVMGLATALSVAESGASVILLEATEIGDGASGRNGGLIVPIMRPHPSSIIKKLGEPGERLVKTVIRSADHVFELIDRFRINCDAVRNGFLQPVHAKSLLSAVEGTANAWAKYGASCRFIDAGETAKHLGTNTYHGALFEPAGGYVNPLAYTRGLAKAGISLGVDIYTNSTVIQAEVSSAKRWRLLTNTGSVEVDKVVQCTGVQLPGVPNFPGIGPTRSLVPMVLHGLTTRPLPEEVHRKILPGKVAATDTRNYVLSVGYDCENRLVTSAAAPLGDGTLGMKQMARFVAGRLERVFPDLADIQFEYIWKGTAALNRHWLPSLYETAPDWYALTTCNGRGMALSTITGQMFGKALAGGNLENFVLPRAKPKPVALRKVIGGVMARVLMPAGALQDRWCELSR